MAVLSGPADGAPTLLGGPTLQPDGLEAYGGWPKVLAQVFSRIDLSEEEAYAVGCEVLLGRAGDVPLAALLGALRAKGESAAEIAGFVGALRTNGDRVELGGLADQAIDTCGTGGDRSGTINVSTLAAFVVAGAGGTVCKHGNRAASSRAGSADLLEALGVVVSLGPSGVTHCVEETGFGFCFAPRYHPALRYAAPVRAAIGVATVFNVLGPLANPANVKRQVVGVSSPPVAARVLEALERGGAVHAMVVYGLDGLDELSTVARSLVLESRLEPGGERLRREYEVDPVALGLAPATREDLIGGDAAHNAARAGAILAGERGPQRDLVLLNGAAGLVVAGLAADLSEGLAVAEAALDGGSALDVLEEVVRVSRREAALEA